METFDFLVLSFQSSPGKRKIFSKKRNMEAVEVKLEDILSCEKIPIVRLKSYAINAFVMGYHVYKKNWTPSIGDELQGFMEPTNKLEKYTVLVKGKDKDVIGHLPLGKSGEIAKTVFYFLKPDKNHHCKITVPHHCHKCWWRTSDESSMSNILSRRRKVYNYPPRKTFVKFLKFTQKYR